MHEAKKKEEGKTEKEEEEKCVIKLLWSGFKSCCSANECT